MKVLLICGLVLAGAFLADAAGGRELCGLSNDEIKGVKSRALEIIGERGDKAADLIKTKCEADVDFGELISTVFSETVANGIKAAYAQCKPASR
ncbi:hypothetical protein MTO96_047127 [Rhipicephalus appendiculatus]